MHCAISEGTELLLQVHRVKEAQLLTSSRRGPQLRCSRGCSR